jgi:hypothetical protein
LIAALQAGEGKAQMDLRSEGEIAEALGGGQDRLEVVDQIIGRAEGPAGLVSAELDLDPPAQEALLLGIIGRRRLRRSIECRERLGDGVASQGEPAAAARYSSAFSVSPTCSNASPTPELVPPFRVEDSGASDQAMELPRSC